MNCRIGLSIPLVFAVFVAPAIAVGAEGVGPATKPTMHRIYEALSGLLLASLAEDGFKDPAQRSKVMERLRVLARSSAELELHADQRDPTFRYLNRSFGRDIADIQQSYLSARFEEARFFVMEMTQNCIACHSQLPNAGNFELAKELTASAEVTDLDRREQVNLQFATRQFDAALRSWEAAFVDPNVSPLDLDVTGELTGYLTLCLRVKRDAARAQHGLRRIAARGDTPLYLKGRIRAWSAALETLEKERYGQSASDAPNLARARKLVIRVDGAGGFPYPHGQLIYDLAASSDLYRLLDTQTDPAPDLAEAFYLLGAIETRSADSYWVPQAEFHLETAVRLAPDGPFAVPAYELLEEYSVINYGGTTEEWVPEDVRRRLFELQKILEPGLKTARP